MFALSIIKNRRFCGGFTLVELVLVLTIAGVLAAVAGPRMVDRSAFQTHGAAAEIRTALRYAQKLAMAKNREVCVTTSATPDLTLMFTDTPGPACGEVVDRPDGDTINPTYTVTLPNGIDLTPVMTFRFDGQGRPSAAVNLMVGGSAPVIVEPETGYVH